MAQLRTNNFTFNSIELSSFGFQVITLGKNDTNRKIGTSRSITKTENVHGSYQIDKLTPGTESLSITITKVNKKGDALAITNSDIEKLNEWLFTPTTYKELIANDEDSGIVYFGIFTNATQHYFQNGVGYITLTFELNGSHAYSTIQEITKEVNGSTTFTINLRNNMGEQYYPDIEFNITQGDSFHIKNLTLDKTMKFSNLTNETKHGKVYGEGAMFMMSLVDDTVNLREKSNRKFLPLCRGKNRITINGTGTFKFTIQPKVALQ